MKLGIMEGRLVPPDGGRFQSFPRERWRDEFALAAAAGLDTLEWIYDAYGEDVNPLSTSAGITELTRLSEQHGVAIDSVCADWFMDYPLLAREPRLRQERWQRLNWLMRQCAPLGINRMVIPFVDASAIQNDADIAELTASINAMSEMIDRTGVELHLETALSPQDFASLLAGIPHPGVKVNYDSGNSASLGFRPDDEFDYYGSRVGSVHLKDRVKGAGTVPLGSGNTDFAALFRRLMAANYRGDFILQVARGRAGEELSWTRQNAHTARQWMSALKP